MSRYTLHNLARMVSQHWKGHLMGLALIALVVLPLILLIFPTDGAATAQTGGSYALTRSVISSGGGTLSGGSYTLTGVIGQPEAGMLTGGQYTLGGGFWGAHGSMYRIYLPLVVRS